MGRRSGLASAALLALALAAPALAAGPAKPSAKPAASSAFDARDPAALVGLLATMDAKANVLGANNGVVVLDIATPGGKFGAQFVDCDANGKACGMVAFSTAFERRGANLAQINVFNRSQVACRGYLTDDGRANVMYGAMLSARTNAAGRNTAIKTSVMPITGPVTSFIAWMVASRGGWPCSM